jgi:hypothetical protein
MQTARGNDTCNTDVRNFFKRYLLPPGCSQHRVIAWSVGNRNYRPACHWYCRAFYNSGYNLTDFIAAAAIWSNTQPWRKSATGLRLSSTRILCTSKDSYLSFINELVKNRGRDGVVGVATGYGLDGPGMESRCRRDFPPRPGRPWGPLSLLYNGYRVFPGGNAAGAWRWPPNPI